MQRFVAIAAAAVVLVACSSPEELAQGVGITGEAQAAAQAGPAGAAFADKAEARGAVREFGYTWPAEVSAIPALVARFTAERDAALAEQKADWDAALVEFAGEDCIGCISRSYEKGWEVAANLPRFLSLSASTYFYTGGAHGNGTFEALVWDRETGGALDPKALFASPEALEEALHPAWCQALKVQRTERVGPESAEDSFFSCPPIADLALVPRSAGGTAFDTIELLAAPYVAGSYAEGTYEVTLPVTAEVIRAVKPEYRAAFAPGT